jgi:hypothetical protein
MHNTPMHNTLARESAPKPPATDPVAAAARLERDLRNAQRLNRRIDLLASRRKKPAATKRVDRSTLDEVAGWLGVSRSTVSRILEEPPLRLGGKQDEREVWGGKRHDHGTGRRRRAGAGSGTRGNIRRRSSRTAYAFGAAS